MHDPRSNFSGFAQRVPDRVSRLLDVRGGNVTNSRTDSFVNVQGAWDTTGQPTAALVNITDNGRSSVFSRLLDLQVSGTSLFRFFRNGNFAVQNGSITALVGTVTVASGGAYLFNARGGLYSSADGILLIQNQATTDFGRLQFGGTTSSFPAIGRSGASLEIFGADGAGPGGLLVYNTKTTATNFERLDINWAANVAQVWTEAGSGGGTARDLVLGANATERMRLAGATTALSFFGVATVVKQTSGANLTNNVTAGGTTDQIDDITSLTVYATDAATIRNDIYQLARKLKQVNDALRAYGLLT